jgi:hypothetical protein
MKCNAASGLCLECHHRGRIALQACIINFRTTETDIDQTLEVFVMLAATGFLEMKRRKENGRVIA